jgi:hypothetical protein
MSKPRKKPLPQKNIQKGKTSAEIVKRHLSDKDDKITEDDLKNLHIDLSLPGDEAHEPLPIKKNKQRPKDSEKDKDTLTPWDVISE